MIKKYLAFIAAILLVSFPALGADNLILFTNGLISTDQIASPGGNSLDEIPEDDIESRFNDYGAAFALGPDADNDLTFWTWNNTYVGSEDTWHIFPNDSDGTGCWVPKGIYATAQTSYSDIITTSPWVDVRAYDGGLEEAVADSFTAGKEIWVTDAQTLTGNLTPSNRTIRVLDSGSIDVDGAYTLNLASATFIGSPGCFGSSITVTGLHEDDPEWWYDGDSDYTDEIEKAAAALADGGIMRISEAKAYTITPITIDENNITIEGVGYGTKLTTSNTTATIIITGDNVTFRNLRVYRSAQASAETPAFRFNGVDGGLLDHVWIYSQDSAVQIGALTDAVTSTNVKIKDCIIERCENNGIFSRTGTDAPEMAHISVINTTLYQYDSEPGVELWTGDSLVDGCTIIAPNKDGGTAGITCGGYRNHKVANNYVEGFSYGIEVGNCVGAISLSNNQMDYCGRGYSFLSVGSPYETDLSVVGGGVTLRDTYSTYGMYHSGAESFTVNGFTIRYKTDLSYTNTSSRQMTGIYCDNDFDRANLNGCIFINLNIGLQMSAGSYRTTITGCTFDNVKYPSYHSGGAPNEKFVGCNFHNVGPIYNNGYVGVFDSNIYNESDFTYVDSPLIQSLTSAYSVVEYSHNSFENVSDTVMVSDGTFAIAAASYKRPTLFINDDFWEVVDRSSWADVETDITNAGYSVPKYKEIKTYSTDLSFIYDGQSLIYYTTAAPTTGTWPAGSTVWDTDGAAGAAPGWRCTTSGTFSAATDATGSTTNGNPEITGMTDTSDFAVGEYVTVSAGFAAGPHKIIAISATSVTLDVNATSDQAGVTVATPDAVFKAMANISA